jgi:hypothetical protein
MPKHCSKDSQLAKYAGKASDHRGVSARGITSLGARCSLKIWQTCGSIRVPARASKQSSPALLWPSGDIRSAIANLLCGVLQVASEKSSRAKSRPPCPWIGPVNGGRGFDRS